MLLSLEMKLEIEVLGMAKKKKKNSEKYCGLMGTGNIFMVIPTIHVNHRNIILSVLLDFHAIV